MQWRLCQDTKANIRGSTSVPWLQRILEREINAVCAVLQQCCLVYWGGRTKCLSPSLDFVQNEQRSYFNISSPPPKTGWSIAYEGKFPSPRLCFDTSVSSTSNASNIHAPSPQRDSSNVGTPGATKCTTNEKIIVIDGAAIPGVNGTYNPKPNSTMYCKAGMWD